MVEYDSGSYTNGPIWFFFSRSVANVDEKFNNGLDIWRILGPNGIQKWSISNSSYAGGEPPELIFDAMSSAFTGQSYVMFNMEMQGSYSFSFRHYFDYLSGTNTIGFRITTNSGSSWQTIWEISPTSFLGPETISGQIPQTNNDFKIGFYILSNPFTISYWYIDDVLVMGALTPPLPPYYLEARADTAQLRVYLNWPAGSCPYPISGYYIRRKVGLPLDTSNYSILTVTDRYTFSYIDYNILPNKTYTYKISTLCGDPSLWSNEATAYVPNIVPVELKSFSAEVNGSDVKLIWPTATETNTRALRFKERSQESEVRTRNGNR